MNIFKKICLLLMLFSGGIGFTQTEQEVINSVLAYRDSVFLQLDSGEAEKVNVRLDHVNYDRKTHPNSPSVEVTYYFLTLDEIESIYLLQHDFQKVLDILTENEFTFNEKLLLYREVKNEANSEKKSQRYFFIAADSLWTFQGNLLSDSETEIEEAVENSEYDTETKAFLKVFLKYKIAYHLDVESAEYYKTKIKEREVLHEYYSSLSAEAKKVGNAFIKTYPNSKYRPFIEEFIIEEYEISKFAFGFEFHAGTMLPTTDLKTYLHPSFHTFLGPKLYYGKTFLNLNVGLGVNLGKQEFLYDTLWNGVSNFVASIELGRAIDIGEKFSISPLVGLRKLLNFYPGYKGFASQFPLTYGLEMNFGRNISKEPYNSFSPNLYSGRERTGFHFKILYQNPKYNTVIPELNGGFLTLTFGTNLAFFSRKYGKKE